MLMHVLIADGVQALEGMQNVVEGLSRVTALLPAKEAAEAGQHLIAPFLHQAQACLDSESGIHHHSNKLPITSVCPRNMWLVMPAFSCLTKTTCRSLTAPCRQLSMSAELALTQCIQFAMQVMPVRKYGPSRQT